MLSPTIVTPRETLEHIRRLAEQESARNSARGAAMAAVVPDLARLLMRDFGVTRVVLFGSVARGDVNERSDIDLAVEGLADSDYFSALGALGWVTPFDIDLVPVKDASPGMLDSILAEGIQVAP